MAADISKKIPCWCVNCDTPKNSCPECHDTEERQDPTHIWCNMCGGTMVPTELLESDSPCGPSAYGLVETTIAGGYFSDHLLDCTKYTFSLCELCLRKLFYQFKIPVKVCDEPYWVGDALSSKEELESYEYSQWRKNGGYHQAFLNGMCNSVKECPNKAKYTESNGNEITELSICDEHIVEAKKNRKYSYFVPFVSYNMRTFL